VYILLLSSYVKCIKFAHIAEISTKVTWVTFYVHPVCGLPSPITH